MGKRGFFGTVLGAAVGIGLAPFTAGASIPLMAAAGGFLGGSAGSALDASSAAKRGERKANEAAADQYRAQNAMNAERAKYDARLNKERAKVDAGIARSMRRRFRSSGGFLGGSDGTEQPGVLG